jgi:putative nucleotidyltransferase with HDIG domain
MLTFRVLRLANSAYYRRGDVEITSIGEALVRLGNNALINMVIAESCSRYFNAAGEGYDLKRGELWRHSIACALVSQRLADKTGFKDREMLFTACIMHDMGKTLQDDFVNRKKQDIIHRLKDSGVTFTQAEMEVLGYSHAEIGARVLEKWEFPEDIVSAVRYHHEPSRTVKNKKLVYHVYLSDIICLMMGIGLGLGGLSYESQKEVFDLFSLSEADVQMLFVNLIEEMAKAEDWLRMS